jgi:hypothetical protein
VAARREVLEPSAGSLLLPTTETARVGRWLRAQRKRRSRVRLDFSPITALHPATEWRLVHAHARCPLLAHMLCARRLVNGRSGPDQPLVSPTLERLGK